MKSLLVLFAALTLTIVSCNNAEVPTQPQESTNAFAKQPFDHPTDTRSNPWGGTLPNGNPVNPQASGIEDIPFEFVVPSNICGDGVTYDVSGTLHFVDGVADGTMTFSGTLFSDYGFTDGGVREDLIIPGAAHYYYMTIPAWSTGGSCAMLTYLYFYTTIDSNGDITLVLYSVEFLTA